LEMSFGSDLKFDMERANRDAGGAHGTRDERSKTIRLFVVAMTILGYQIRSVRQIGRRHIVAYLGTRQGKSPGSLQKEMSHLRQLLKCHSACKNNPLSGVIRFQI
ncbi:MAG: phage integrase N-terminal domain-containing protein, partial [Nevskiales bacterium]